MVLQMRQKLIKNCLFDGFVFGGGFNDQIGLSHLRNIKGRIYLCQCRRFFSRCNLRAAHLSI